MSPRSSGGAHQHHHRPPNKPTRLLAAAVAAVALLLVGAASAVAAPANDDFAAATQIAGLPFTDTVDPTTATTEPGEPQFCNQATQSVWYEITPTQAATLAADTQGSTALGQITVYRADASGFGGLTFVGCANFGPTPVVFQVQAGSTYYLQASPLFGTGGTLTVNLAAIPVPANDDFAAATPITATPFADTVDLTAATVEPGEPAGCQGAGPPSQPTVWYAFTPAQTGSYVFSGGSSAAAYTGASLTSLTQLGCSSFAPLYFHAVAGVPVHLQVAGGGPFSGSAQITLGVAPAVMAGFFFSPADPSTLDTVQFFDTTFDPAGIASETWKLGDGTSSTACCPQHRYTTDGDYTAQLSVTTTDGRQAQTSQVVHVRTHDVAISAFSAPAQARVGQTKSLSIGVSDTRYAETVQVALLRSVAGGGFEQVGQVTGAVPVRKRGAAATFDIRYTFASSDATLGKVSFEAVATLVGDRDANPADNTVTAVPTKVKG